MKVMCSRLPLIIALVAVLTLFSSCTKEELVAPCGHDEISNAKSSDLGSTGPGAPPADAASGGADDPDGTGISDDGDDLSGSERNRKKRAN